MDGIIGDAGKQILALGLPGTIILALGFVCYKLFYLYTESQNKRIDEKSATATALAASTTALDRLSDLIRDRLK